MSKLVLSLPDGTTLDIPLARERTTIGRRADNDICLPNLAVSGEHAVVVTILDDSFLEDLNSTNGTLVNGNAIAKHFLRDRDQIDIGRHRLVYCADDDAKLEPDVTTGVARVSVRDFGARVEPAKPFVRVPPAAASDGPTAASALSNPATAEIAPAAARVASKVAPPQPKAALSPQAVPAPASLDLPALKLLSGVSASTVVALTKAETTVGRPGVQVAAIVQNGLTFRLKPLEGTSAPTVNGKPIGRDGQELTHGDVIEIAGARVEFVDPRTRATQEHVAA